MVRFTGIVVRLFVFVGLFIETCCGRTWASKADSPSNLLIQAVLSLSLFLRRYVLV